MKREGANLAIDMESTSATFRVTKRRKKLSDDRRRELEPLPIDVVMEILKRLPVKTLERFLCVSKLWESIIRGRFLKKLYIAESLSSSNRPGSLIFAFRRDGCVKDCFFFSSLQPQSPDEASVVATFHKRHSTNMFTINSSSVHGLICYGPPFKVEVYNTSTRKTTTLPIIKSMRKRLHHFLGYDPIDADYKMLCMTTGKHGVAQELQALTLGKDKSWRRVENSLPPTHSPDSPQICIDGVLYYGAYLEGRKDHRGVISFDVRSEALDLIRVPPGVGLKLTTRMTKYNGKLALMYTKFRRIHLWVLEDAASHEWSNESFPMPRLTGSFEAFCAIDETGEFVLAPRELYASPFFVVYYDPKKKSVRKVDIHGITEKELPLWGKYWMRRTMSIFPGQIDNLTFL